MQTKLTKKEIIKVLSHMQIMKSKDYFSFFFYKYNQFASFLKLKSVLFKKNFLYSLQLLCKVQSILLNKSLFTIL